MNNSRNDELLIALGKKIKELREKRKLSMDGLAAECGIEKKLVYLIEHGKSNPTISTLALLSRALGESLSDMFKEL